MYDIMGMQCHLPFQIFHLNGVCVQKITSLTWSAHVTWTITWSLLDKPVSTLYLPTPNMPRNDVELKAMAKKTAYAGLLPLP